MGGYGPKLPVEIDPVDGFTLTKTIMEQVKQNLKMLILTVPGERVMKPKFGVGLKRYLFEQNTEFLRQEISNKINEQVNIYMPFVKIKRINYSDIESAETDANTLKITIQYSIDSISALETLIVEP